MKPHLKLSPVTIARPDTLASAVLTIDTGGRGFVDITGSVKDFLRTTGGAVGGVTVFVRHTSASLTIQENADPDVLTDLDTALSRLAPEQGSWIHDAEGPDDMPAHIKTMLTSVSLFIPVMDGALGLGTWQGIYLIEHRAASHRREIALQFWGSQ